MKRRSFVKSLLAVSIASALPALAVSEDLLTHGSNVISVYSIIDLPVPVDGVINLDSNTTYDFKNTISIPASIRIRGAK